MAKRAKKKRAKRAANATSQRARTREKRGSPHPRWVQKFLDELSSWPNVSRACEVAGVDRKTAYRHRAKDSEFAREWESARSRGIESLEDVAENRARDGWEEPVYQRGDLVGYVRKYDNKLLVEVMRANSQKWSRRTEISGPGGGPIESRSSVKLDDLTADDLETVRQAIRAASGPKD